MSDHSVEYSNKAEEAYNTFAKMHNMYAIASSIIEDETHWRNKKKKTKSSADVTRAKTTTHCHHTDRKFIFHSTTTSTTIFRISTSTLLYECERMVRIGSMLQDAPILDVNAPMP